MYVIKNALRNITRAKGRSILNLILVLVISVSACVSLSIKESAESAKQSAYDSLSVTAQIGVDRSKIMQQSGNDKSSMREAMSKTLSLDEMQKYAKSTYVKDFQYTLRTSLNGSEDFTAFSTSESSTSSDKNMPGGKMCVQNRGDFSITGYSTHDAMTEFINGTYKITEGSMFNQDDSSKQCIISSELATENSLKTGSKITFTNPQNEDETFEATVCGIYENSDSSSTENAMFGGSDPANNIYMSYKSAKALVDESSKNPITVTDSMTNEETTSVLTNSVSGTYVLSDAASYEEFVKDVKNMGLDTSIYTVTSLDVSEYEKSTAPLDNLSKYTMIFFIVVLVIGAIILVVFNLFTIKTRKYEIGVLSAIGMNKKKVAMQFIIESLSITLIAAVLGAAIGAVSSAPIADKLLASQISAIETSNESQSNNFGGNFQGGGMQGGPNGGMGKPSQGFGQGKDMNRGSNKAVNYISSISASTNLTVILELLGVCILLTILSSGIAMVSILRYDPLKILSDRV